MCIPIRGCSESAYLDFIPCVQLSIESNNNPKKTPVNILTNNFAFKLNGEKLISDVTASIVILVLIQILKCHTAKHGYGKTILFLL